MRVARKYVSKEGLPAATTCKTRGWDKGTWLSSESWSSPRKILAFDGGTSEFVALRSHVSGRSRVMILPKDVQAVPEPQKKVKTPRVVLIKDVGSNEEVKRFETKLSGAAYDKFIVGLERKVDTERFYIEEVSP